MEAADLHKYEIAVKKLLFKKSHEDLGAHAKVLSLRTEIIVLTEKAEESQEKMARLEEKSSQQEERLVKLEEELSRKDELCKQTKVELINDVVDAYAVGFEDAMTQVACVPPGVDLSQTGLPKKIVGGQLVNAKE